MACIARTLAGKIEAVTIGQRTLSGQGVIESEGPPIFTGVPHWNGLVPGVGRELNPDQGAIRGAGRRREMEGGRLVGAAPPGRDHIPHDRLACRDDELPRDQAAVGAAFSVPDPIAQSIAVTQIGAFVELEHGQEVAGVDAHHGGHVDCSRLEAAPQLGEAPAGTCKAAGQAQFRLRGSIRRNGHLEGHMDRDGRLKRQFDWGGCRGGDDGSLLLGLVGSIGAEGHQQMLARYEAIQAERALRICEGDGPSGGDEDLGKALPCLQIGDVAQNPARGIRIGLIGPASDRLLNGEWAGNMGGPERNCPELAGDFNGRGRIQTFIAVVEHGPHGRDCGRNPAAILPPLHGDPAGMVIQPGDGIEDEN